jgi:hypothetical protein
MFRLRRLHAAVALAVLALAVAGCGDDDDDAEADVSTPSTTTDTASPAATYSTTRFKTPLDVTVPGWLDAEPQEDSARFVTWESPDGSRGLRILHPVEVYPPGADAPVAPPEDFVSYVLDHAESGAEISEKVETEIDGRPATVVTATTNEPFDGSLGCPEAGVPADACFGLQPELALRIAVVEADAEPLLIWLRVPGDADLAAEADRFDEILAGIQFADREPETEAAAATPYDGEYEWTLTAEDARAHDPNFDPSDESFPWTITLVLHEGEATQQVSGSGFPTETYRATYEVEGDQITFHFSGPDAIFTLTQDADGTIHATAVEPVADPGGAFVMTAKPWTKTG